MLSLVASGFGTEDFSSSSTWALDGPAATILKDDLIILAGHNNATPNITTPFSGFTAIPGGPFDNSSTPDNRLAPYYKVAAGGETGPYSITWDAATTGIGGWAVIRGAHPTDPFGGVAPVPHASSSGTAKDAGPITPAYPNSMLLAMFSGDPGNNVMTFTWDGGITSIYFRDHATLGTQWAAAAYKMQTTIAAESMGGDLNNGDAAAGFIISIRPAPAGGNNLLLLGC